jgi:3-oxoacyl-[acyl-carrier-protein] synthase II
VVIAGLGAVTPCGNNVARLWDAVRHGRSAITTLDDPRFANLPVRIGGLVRGFDPRTVLSATLARRLMPSQQWAIAAADEAMRDAGIEVGRQSAAGAPAEPEASAADAEESPSLPWDRHRFCVLAATGSGPVDATLGARAALASRGPRGVPVTFAAYGAADAVGTVLSKRYGATGASYALSATCASGSSVLGQGLRLIRHGYADAVLVVAVEDCLNPVNMASNANLRALASGYEDDPSAACRPFDAGRHGFVMAQGAGAILLVAEPAGSDSPRQASGGPSGSAGLAELAGFGASEDAFHATAPHPEGRGAAEAISDCLADAGVGPGDVEHINAHATGTVAGDAAEIAAFERVFGTAGHRIPISATKAVTGHLMGASGTVEAILATITVRTGLLPATLNLTDSAFPEWDIVTGRARSTPVHTVLSTSFGFGGHDAAILVRRLPGAAAHDDLREGTESDRP